MNIFGYKGWNHKLTKYSPSEAVDFIVKDLAPLFKAEGYKKKDRTWTKDMGEFSFIVSLRGSRWNGEETGAAFAVDYGIFVPQIFKVLDHQELPKHPTSYDFIFGQVMTGKSKRMPWEIFDNTDIEALKASVVVQVKEECVDVFAKISSLEDVKARLIGGLFDGMHHHHTLALAVLCAQMGDSLHAQQYFQQAMNDQIRTPSYREKAKKLAAQYGSK